MADVKVPPKVLPVIPENYPADIPSFTSEAEERAFWDTHDSEFYFAEGEDVTDNPPPDLLQNRTPKPAPLPSRWTGEDFGERVIVRFLSIEMDRVRALATSRGVEIEELIKTWIMDSLNQAEDQSDNRATA